LLGDERAHAEYTEGMPPAVEHINESAGVNVATARSLKCNHASPIIIAVSLYP
jgi:hypothetical protein